jgi:hypothetical protein
MLHPPGDPEVRTFERPSWFHHGTRRDHWCRVFRRKIRGEPSGLSHVTPSGSPFPVEMPCHDAILARGSLYGAGPA